MNQKEKKELRTDISVKLSTFLKRFNGFWLSVFKNIFVAQLRQVGNF
jgi:hypothetical protein